MRKSKVIPRDYFSFLREKRRKEDLTVHRAAAKKARAQNKRRGR